MKKETGIAVFLGILAGILIAFFVISGTRREQQTPSGVIQSNITPTIVIATNEISPITIEEPKSEAIVTSADITVKGSAQEDALVVIQTAIDERVFKNKAKTFSEDVQVAPGENTIKITTYSHKNIDSKSVVIYYLPK